MAVNRYEPNLPPSAYETFTISSPTATHYRPGTCEEAGCTKHRNGWRTVVDEGTGLGQMQAAYIRTECRTTLAPAPAGIRRYAESREGALTVFTFPAGQTCFPPADGSPAHMISLDRPQFFLVRGGDWRARTSPIRRHSGPDPWADELHTTTDRVWGEHG